MSGREIKYIQKLCDEHCADYGQCETREHMESTGVLTDYECNSYKITTGEEIVEKKTD